MGNVFFAQKIKALREGANLTMDALAKEMDVSKSRVNMWENGGTIPRQDVLTKLSQYFQISIDDLLGNFQQTKESKQVRILQRNLKKLSEEDVAKANKILSQVFSEIWSNK